MGAAQSKLTSEQLTHLERVTHFNRRELKNWYTSFRVEHPSGQIGKDKFSKIYNNCFGGDNADQLVEYAFNVFDKDRNGGVDFEEFVCNMSTTLRGTERERFEWAFQLYDLNRDGTVTYGELLEVMRSASTAGGDPDYHPENHLDQAFTKAGLIKDAKLTFEQFSEVCQQDPGAISLVTIFDESV